ncbi:MAG: DUF438 domain-containing protein [Lachnospiraceae bacterium]|nr:DUF438 domain-containing protein [Lachnospiraceae bacterium]
MSEYINNRELRKNTIKDIIKQLHEGKTIDEVKTQFEKVFEGVTATEISEAEGALIAEGLPVEEVQKLCDVHASVFKGSIEEIHQPEDPSLIPGHPVHILKLENREIEKIIKKIRNYIPEISIPSGIQGIREGIDKLIKVGVHYKRKENLLFPYMEKYGITAPPKVMWGVDDEIRAAIKDMKEVLSLETSDFEKIVTKLLEVLEKIEEMIFKEENIMIPMLTEVMTQDEWKLVSEESSEIGFIISDIPHWKPIENNNIPTENNSKKEADQGLIQLPSGVFKLEELIGMLNTLPMDITFVNKDDEVKYFSEGKERAFPRTRAIIGRNVSNCHPPASVHVVEKLVEDFKAGIKDQEDFWIKAGEKYILIRYYAVRNERKEYLGVLEVTQDIKPIQEITGEKRLLS